MRHDNPPTGLYGSEGGAVACERHTPFRGSDTWKRERWAAVTWQHYFDAFRAYPDLAASMMACESCGYTPQRPTATVALSTGGAA